MATRRSAPKAGKAADAKTPKTKPKAPRKAAAKPDPTKPKKRAGVAQQAERRPSKSKVPGSSPGARSKRAKPAPRLGAS